MLTINQILKKGAKLRAVKLDPNDPKIKKLIEQTRKAQAHVLALTKIDYHALQNQIITI